MRKLLYLDDLYDFYVSQNQSVKFDASQNNDPLFVQVHGSVNFEKEESNNTAGLMKVTLQACHTEKNLNQSSISLETMQQKLLPTFKNRPILGYIHYPNNDGTPEFYGHNMHVETNSDGEEELIYDESPVGIIPESNNAHLEYDKDHDRYNVMIDGYIFEEYTKAAEILQREEECSVSVEIAITQYSYNAKEKFLSIDDGYFSGVTILGVDDDGVAVKPGMAGSNIKINDFSKENNSLVFESQNIENKLVDALNKLNYTLSNLSNKSEKGGEEHMTKFEELLNKYNKTVEDIDFEYEDLTDEELEQKFAEVFGEEEPEEPAEPTEDEEPTAEPEEKPTEEPEEPTEEPEEPAEPVQENETKKFQFELSLDDIHYAICNLTSIYRNDEEWCYPCEIYESYFIMIDYDSNQYYKQSYEKNGENVSLSGEREKVFAEFITEAEKSKLDDMRANYSVISEKLASYEKAALDAQKADVFADKAYESIKETEEFKALVENKDNYSVDDLRKECELVFAKYARQNFALNNQNEPEAKPVARHGLFSNQNREKKPYGNLFADKN